MSNRRERFREAMARLDAAADPARAIERGFYVERPGRSVASELAARLELRPTSSHLIIGGVGSGKTTLLLVARDRLNQLADASAIYVDVSEKHDISRMAPGVLVVLAGLVLSELAENTGNEDMLPIQQAFQKWAHGEVIENFRNAFGIRSTTKKEGLLSLPGPPFDAALDEDSTEFSSMRAATEKLAALRAAIARQNPNITLIIDSLDRITDPVAFARVVEQDVAAIRWAGIGVVLAGPLRSMYGTDRPVTDRFDYFYYQPAIDVSQDDAGRDFLARVLHAREPVDFLPDPICQKLAELSGGVLRDLISLAQLAVEEAYLDGADSIEAHHVESAGDAFGRKHMLGLGSDELEVLQRVRLHGSFVQTSDKDLALLVTRRVLEYQNGRTRYAVHPTIAPLLEQLARKP